MYSLKVRTNVGWVFVDLITGRGWAIWVIGGDSPCHIMK